MCEIANRFWNDETGLAVIEYALLLALVAVAIGVATSDLGAAVVGVISSACTSVGGPC